MRLLKEAEEICRELENKNGLRRTLGNQALILEARDDLEGAMRLHKEQERISVASVGGETGSSFKMRSTVVLPK